MAEDKKPKPKKSKKVVFNPEIAATTGEGFRAALIGAPLPTPKRGRRSAALDALIAAAAGQKRPGRRPVFENLELQKVSVFIPVTVADKMRVEAAKRKQTISALVADLISALED